MEASRKAVLPDSDIQKSPPKRTKATVLNSVNFTTPRFKVRGQATSSPAIDPNICETLHLFFWMPERLSDYPGGSQFESAKTLLFNEPSQTLMAKIGNNHAFDYLSEVCRYWRRAIETLRR